MRFAIVFLAMSLSVILARHSLAQDAAATTILWHSSLEEAREASREDGRPVIAYFTFDTCVWCKRLEAACYDKPAVVELSRSFHWVTVNRDHTPEIPQRFNVSAYPSLLVLGNDDENVHRFQGYHEEDGFLDQLRHGLRRYQRYRDGGPDWFEPPTRPDQLTDEVPVNKLPAPSTAVPGGLTEWAGRLFVAQDGLHVMRGEEHEATLVLSASVADLAHDEEHLYAVTFGWTAGQPIYVLNPDSGDVVRQIVTEANRENRSHGAKGLAWYEGSLVVLEGMHGTLAFVDPGDGRIRSRVATQERWLSGLDFDGRYFVTGSREAIFWMDPDTGETVRRLPVQYPIRSVAAAGTELLVMEQPVFGFGPEHERIQVWPKQESTSIYSLSVD